MQMIQTGAQTQIGTLGDAGGSASGFGTIPTRIQDLAPLVVEGDSTVKIQVVDTLIDLAGQLANVHRVAAEAYISQGCYEEAVPHLLSAVTFAADNIEYHNQHGFVQFLTGDDAGAIASFERVLQDEPRQVDALFNLGMVLFGQQDLARAEACFRQVVEVTPGDAEAWNNRGACIYQAGNRADASICFRRALEIDPQNEDATANLAAC